MNEMLKGLFFTLFSAACLTSGILLERYLVVPFVQQQETEEFEKEAPLTAGELLRKDLTEKIDKELRAKGYSLDRLQITRLTAHTVLAKDLLKDEFLKKSVAGAKKIETEIDVFGGSKEDLNLIFQVSFFNGNNKVDEVGFSFELKDLL